jgi:hypothetical protein
MRKLGLALSFAVLAAGTVAHAQSIDVAASATSATQLGDHGTVNHPDGTNTLTDGSRAVQYTSTTSITSSEISFESGGISTGDQTRQTSISRIDLTVSNNGDGTLAPTFKSQITPAGMGIYLGNNSLGNCFSSPASCAQTQGNHTFADLTQVSGANLVAGVSFDFLIQQDGQTLRDISGGITVSQDGSIVVFPNVDQASSTLTGFVTLDQFGKIDPTTGQSMSALGFAWDATDVSVDLNSIGGFSSSVISYIVTVSTFSTANCFADDSTCLVTYAGFGDPVGRDGAVNNLFSGALSASFADGPPTGPNVLINGVSFSPETLKVPQFDANGNLVLTQNGVPEPATWMSLILGFGAMGAALRRRRVIAYN